MLDIRECNRCLWLISSDTLSYLHISGVTQKHWTLILEPLTQFIGPELTPLIAFLGQILLIF